MSEFLAEARILVRPDTTGFRAQLEAALAAATATPIAIPVTPVVAGPGLAGLTAETTALTSVQDSAVVSTQALAAAQEKEAATAVAATEAQAAHSRSISQLARGAGASGLTLFGLRGATLAASGAFLAGTAAVVGFSKAVQSAATLQTELNVFQATAGATADEMTRASEAAKQLGRDITLPGVSANDAAVALTELSKAGLSVQDSLDGARGALQLATAAQIDNVTATNLVAGALNAFGLAGTQAVHVADLLTGAAKESQGNIADFGTALGQAAAVSHQFGVSIEDTLTLLTELGKAGLEGGRAGTSLRVAFLRLINPTKKAADELNKLNIQVRDANGNLRPEVFTDISDALAGYSKAQRDAALATIFGSDAIRTAAIIGAQGAGAFQQVKASITEQGLAAQQAAARTKGFQGDVENLKNQMSALGLAVGQLTIGPLSSLVKDLATVAQDAATTADAMVVLGDKVKGVGDSFKNAIPFGNTLAGVLGKVKKAADLANPLFAVTNAIHAASESAKSFGLVADDSAKKNADWATSVTDVKEAVGQLGIQLQQSAADSKVFTQQVTSDTAKLLQSAADSRVDLSKLGQQSTAGASRQGLRTKQIENIVGGFDAKTVRDKINKDNQALLADLQAEQDFLQAQLQRQFVRNRPALKRSLEQSLLGVVNDIDTIQQQAASKSKEAKSKAEQAARDAAQAASAREQALLASFGLARDQQQNKIAKAAQTAGIQDDIKQENALKALVLRQIAQVRERISIEGGRAAAITALRAIIIQINGQLTQLAKQQQAAAEQQRQNLVQSATLDIDLAQITGNRKAEVAARERLIVELKKEQALVKKGTLAWKQLRNDIAEQNAAIAAVTAEKKNNSFGQASFEFLQAQQGFASNLLGNLIPGGATTGLVGGGAQSPVSAALPPLAGAAEARSQGGPTAGQQQSANAILLRILDQLKILTGGQSAPESHQWWSWQRATMDGVGGG